MKTIVYHVCLHIFKTLLAGKLVITENSNRLLNTMQLVLIMEFADIHKSLLIHNNDLCVYSFILTSILGTMENISSNQLDLN